ncbi:hypothetical protein [Parabacteroides sp. AF17-28]|uniref:hypothetical protein n=1 Tax=Parabacteroides sp. AF17-28 TaxID=2292241 RepID=UPI000EFE6131|nr:hypothetical protein [Parabacteroides sp. AF17-28]RHR48096.1 hypothetical protein DWW90_20235 [Parabacteroides sp. AF17-28]
MKLRNFMYATMIACAFASCSKDEVIEGGQEPAKGEGALTITLNTKATKANDATIKDVCVVLLNADGTTVLRKVQSTGSGDVTFSDLEVGTVVKAAAFANLGTTVLTDDQILGVTPIALSVKDGLYDAEAIPMHGVQANTTTVLAGVENVANVQLVRDLAKVQLTGVTLDMNGSVDGEAYQTDFTAGNVALTLKNVAINSAAQAVTYSGVGTTYTAATAWVGGMKPWTWAKKNVSNTDQLVAYNISSSAESVDQVIGTVGKVDAQAITLDKDFIYYVIPNEVKAQPTILTLNADFKITNGVKNGVAINDQTFNAYYNIEIGAINGDFDTVDGGNAYTSNTGIKANKFYDIKAIVVGNGDGSEGNRPTLVVKMSVKDWDKVSQSSVVK